MDTANAHKIRTGVVDMLEVKIQLVDGGKMPLQATEGSAGMDLFACISEKGYIEAVGLNRNKYPIMLMSEDLKRVAPENYVIIAPGETKVVSAGFKVELPKGYEMQVRPRSGNSAKTKLRVANSPGTIDSDYRGIVGVILENIGNEPIVVFEGDKIAQAIIAEVPEVKLVGVEALSDTQRGEGGFGSSGVR